MNVEQAMKMTDEELLKEYLNQANVKKVIERTQDIIKAEFNHRLTDQNKTKLYLEDGQVNIMKQSRNYFNQKKAKELLGEDNTNMCMEKKEVNFVRIVSKESADAMSERLIKNKQED